MPTRECLDCGRLTTRTDSRCPACAGHRNRRRDHARGNRHARGYDSVHDTIRTNLLAALVPGTPCPRCGLGMWPHQDLDAGHSVDLKVNPNARADRLEHASCNRGGAH